jgi:hypothetical protein
MRKCLIILPLLMTASPVLAQDRPAEIRLPPELTDPAMADKLTRTMDGLTDALLDLKVGEIQAAAEGRKATPAERKLTIRDIERRKDPNFDRKLHRQLNETGSRISEGMQAMSDALPAVMKAIDDAGRAIDRAAANLPDPTYPRR